MWRNFENPWVLMILVLIIVVVFGANKLPGAAKNLGRSLKIFKEEVKSPKDEAAPPAPLPPAQHRVATTDDLVHTPTTDPASAVHPANPHPEMAVPQPQAYSTDPPSTPSTPSTPSKPAE